MIQCAPTPAFRLMMMAGGGKLHSSNVERPLQAGERDLRTSGPQTDQRQQRVVHGQPLPGAERRWLFRHIGQMTFISS